MHLSLVNGRPGANTSSIELLQFTMARYVRIRLQGMHATMHSDNNVQWLVDAEALKKRSFYSLRHIKIGARMLCYGHAATTSLAGDDVCTNKQFFTYITVYNNNINVLCNVCNTFCVYKIYSFFHSIVVR